MSWPFRSKISIFVRQLGPIYFAVWAEQVALYLALPKFIALVDRNSRNYRQAALKRLPGISMAGERVECTNKMVHVKFPRVH